MRISCKKHVCREVSCVFLRLLCSFGGLYLAERICDGRGKVARSELQEICPDSRSKNINLNTKKQKPSKTNYIQSYFEKTEALNIQKTSKAIFYDPKISFADPPIQKKPSPSQAARGLNLMLYPGPFVGCCAAGMLSHEGRRAIRG